MTPKTRYIVLQLTQIWIAQGESVFQMYVDAILSGLIQKFHSFKQPYHINVIFTEFWKIKM